MESKTLTVIHQGDSYLLKTGSYRTHLSVDGKVFAKTTELVLGHEPKTIEIGTDKSEVDFYTRTIKNGEGLKDTAERLDKQAYEDMQSILKEECFGDDDSFISLEHEYKWKKAMQGWTPTRKDWVEWVEAPFQILHLKKVDNPCITPYLAESDLSNPVVVYVPSPILLFKEAMKRLDIDISTILESNSYNGVEGKLTMYNRYGDTITYAHYSTKEFFKADDFKGNNKRTTYEEALELYEKAVESIIFKYKQAYAKVHAEINEQNGRKLAETLDKIESQVSRIDMKVKERYTKKYILDDIKKAKVYLGVE